MDWYGNATGVVWERDWSGMGTRLEWYGNETKCFLEAVKATSV